MNVRVGLAGRDLGEILPLLRQKGFEVTDKNPSLFITYGGDGSLVGAERQFPGVPKVPIRSSQVCKRCPEHEPQAILDRLLAEKLESQPFLKVEMRHKGMTKIGMNEVGFHMANPASAVRFNLYVNDRPYVHGDIIADGLIFATPFGSTAYFRAVTHGTFREGTGLAIVSSVNPIEWAVLHAMDRVRVEIVPGPAMALADNDPDQWNLSSGDTLELGAHPQPARIFGFDALTCQECELKDRRPQR